MKSVILVASFVLCIATAYWLGYRSGTKRTSVLLAEQYVHDQIIQCAFDQKGLTALREGKKEAVQLLEERIEFRFGDLNTKLAESTFWNEFVPSFSESSGFNLSSPEIYDNLVAWNDSYQASYRGEER